MRLSIPSVIAVLVVAASPAGGTADVFDVPACQETMVSIEADGTGRPSDMLTGAAIGDSNQGEELRALFGFDLSFLPPGTTITSAVFHARFEASYGDPASLGAVYAGRVYQIKGFPSADLEPQWSTSPLMTPMAEVLGEIASGSDLRADLTAHIQGQYPSPQYHQDRGRAVVRLQFELGTNDDDTGDFIYVHDPRLELDVELPDPISERPLGRHLKRCLPVVASLPGAAGTQWTTELQITARHDGTVWLYFTETRTDGTTSFLVRRIDLDIWESVRYADVLPELFGVEDTKGWLEVFSTDPEVVVTSRVANVGGEGSYGQTVPLVGERQMLRYSLYRFWDRPRKQVNLAMVDADNRTNVGMVNLGPGDVTVEVTAVSPEGPFLGHHEVELEPFEHHQMDGLGSGSFIPEAHDIGSVSLMFYLSHDTADMAAWGNVAVYVSRVDNTTGDAVFVVPR